MPDLVSPVGGAALVAALAVGVLAGFLVQRAVSGESSGARTTSREGADSTSHGLDDLAEELETASSPDAVRAAVETLRSTTDRIAQQADVEGVSPGERAKRIERALDTGEITIASGTDAVGGAGRRDVTRDKGTSGSTGPTSDRFEHVVRAARRVDPPDSREGRRLVSALEAPESVEPEQFRETLAAVVDTLEERSAVADALASVPRDPGDAGERLTEHLRGVDGDRADALRQIGSILSETARDLEACRGERDRLATAAETVCAGAEDAGLSVEGDSPIERVESLARQLDRDEVTLGGDVGDAVRRAVGATDPESLLGRELVAALRDPDGHDLRGTLQEVFETLDDAERLRARLENVHPDEVQDLARTVRSSLSGGTDIEKTVRERVTEIENRAGEDRLLAFAGRQELNFYDKTLVSQLEAGSDDHDAGAQIEAARERRSEMREQFPRKYDDLNHEIPIHLLDTVSELLDDAETALKSGESGRALGMAQAADAVLDATESLYRNNAYHILLRQLRE